MSWRNTIRKQELGQELLGAIEESNTGYAEIKNENGKTIYTSYGYLPVEITPEMLHKVNSEGFDGERKLGGIPHSGGPNASFVRYLKTLGAIKVDPSGHLANMSPQELGM